MLSRQALSLRDVPDLRGEKTEEEAEEGKRGGGESVLWREDVKKRRG